MVGMHLCGQLSPHAIHIYSKLRHKIDSLILAPCCLHKIYDANLKLEAKLAGRNPFDDKVKQLAQTLGKVSGVIDVNIHYDESFRSNTFRSDEGGSGCKNALIVGTRY
eukprot:9310136-Ditylum_brightwellii.AAC.1